MMIVGLLDAAANLVATLPGGGFQDLLAGALLLVRRGWAGESLDGVGAASAGSAATPASSVEGSSSPDQLAASLLPWQLASMVTNLKMTTTAAREITLTWDAPTLPGTDPATLSGWGIDPGIQVTGYQITPYQQLLDPYAEKTSPTTTTQSPDQRSFTFTFSGEGIYSRTAFTVYPEYSAQLPNGNVVGVGDTRFWSGVDAPDHALSLFLDPTAMLAASDGSVWVSYQRSPIAKVVERLIHWINPYAIGENTQFWGYISNADGDGPGNVLTATGCENASRKQCELPNGGLVRRFSHQAITLVPTYTNADGQTVTQSWGTAPALDDNGDPWNLLVRGGTGHTDSTVGFNLENSDNGNFKLANPSVSVATGSAETGWTTPVLLQATPTKLRGGWGGFLRFVLGTTAILTGNFLGPYREVRDAIENLPSAVKSEFLDLLATPLPENQVRQYKFVDGKLELAQSFITTMPGVNGTGGGDTSNAATGTGTGTRSVAVPHALVESTDGQIFVASRGLAGGIDRNNRSGWARFSPGWSTQVGYVHRLGGEEISFTGSIGSGSTGAADSLAGVVLTVTEMGAGSNAIVVGQTVSAPGLPEGTRIISQLTYGPNGLKVGNPNQTPADLGGVGTYLIKGLPTAIGPTTMSQLSAQTIDLSGSATWGTMAAAPDGTVWVGINDLGNSVGGRDAKRVVKNGALEQIAPTADGSWATQHVKYTFMHPPAGFAITETSAAPVEFVGSISGTTLTVTQMESGSVSGSSPSDFNLFESGTGLKVGQYLTGDGVAPGTTITELLTGTGGTGTYQVSTPMGDQTVGVGATTTLLNGSDVDGIEMAADTYALWVNDSTANGREAGVPTWIASLFYGCKEDDAGAGCGFKKTEGGGRKWLNTGGMLRFNNSQNFKLKSTVLRIDSACDNSGCGNRQDVGRGGMGMIAVPGRDAVLVAVGATSLLSEVGYGGAYITCRVAADGGAGNACKGAGAAGQVLGGEISKLWKTGSGKIVEVSYNPDANRSYIDNDRTHGIAFLKVSDKLEIPTDWLGTSEFLMQDAGRPQSLALGSDGSIYMGGSGSGGKERALFLSDINPLNLFDGGNSWSGVFYYAVAKIFLTVQELNAVVCLDLGSCANDSAFDPYRRSYEWKTAGAPAFVAQVWTPTQGLLDTPGDPVKFGAIPRIQSFGQVYPFVSQVTVNPKTGLPTGAPAGIFAQDSQFGGALFLPATPVVPGGDGSVPPLSANVDIQGGSATLSWEPPPTTARSPVMSYIASAYGYDTVESVTTTDTTAAFTSLQTNGGTSYFTVHGTNLFGTSSTANGQVGGGQLWLAADGTTVLPTTGLGVGMVTDGTPFVNGGVDGWGNAYSWDAIPGSDSHTLTWNVVNFDLGGVAGLAAGGGGSQPNQPNVARFGGQTIGLSQALIDAQFDTTKRSVQQAVNVVNLAGAAVNGAQKDVPIRLNYTDGTSEIWTQSFSDWLTPSYFANEAIISTQGHRNTASGGTDSTVNHVFGYSHPTAQGKTLASVTLPEDVDVVLLGLAMSTAIVVSLGQNVSNSPLNTFGITTPPWQVPNRLGFDGRGNYYDAFNLNNMSAPWGDVILRGDPPPSEIAMSWAGAVFQVGPIPTSNGEVPNFKGGDYPRNVVQASGQLIYMPAGDYTQIQLIGAAANGTQTDQAITVNFTDGTSATWTQTFSDWASTPTPGSVAGEAVVNGGTRVNKLGNATNTTANVYGYSYAIPEGKTVQSLALPDGLDPGGKGGNVGILGISLVGTPSVAPWAGVGIVTDGPRLSSVGGFGADGQVIDATPWLGADGVPLADFDNGYSALGAGINLGIGPALTSPNGSYTLRLQADGDLVLAGCPAVLWNTNTAGSGATTLAMQQDGNLVLYTDSGAAVWATMFDNSAAPTSLTADASFETPSVGSGNFQYDPAGSAWTFNGGSGISGNGSGFTAGNPNAPAGSQVAFLQKTGEFSQVITGLQIGQEYTLSFDAAQRSGYPDQSFTVTLGEQPLVSNLSPGSTSYQSYRYAFTAQQSGSQPLTFIGLDPTGQDEAVFIDQVKITQAAVQLVVQDDGNLVMYDADGAPVWAASSSGSVWGASGDYALPASAPDQRVNDRVSQGIVGDGTPFGDGGFDGDGYAYSWEATGGSESATLVWNGVSFGLVAVQQGFAVTSSLLDAGQQLGVGGVLASPNGSYALRLQANGNLVLDGGVVTMWETNTAGSGATTLEMLTDGNLVLATGDGTQVWATGTTSSTNPAVNVVVQDDGNLVMYDTNGAAAWAAASGGGVGGASGNYTLPGWWSSTAVPPTSDGANVVRFAGQTIALSSEQLGAQIDTGDGKYLNVLNLAGAAVNGAQTDQKIKLTYTDWSSEFWTQSFSDWGYPQKFYNEDQISVQPYRNTASGGSQQFTNYIYGYARPIPQGKILESVTLPFNSNVALVGLAMSITESETASGGFDGYGNAYSWNQLTGQASPQSSAFVGVIGGGVTPAVFTGSISTGSSATFLGGISNGTPGDAGTTLAVFQLAADSVKLVPGQYLTGSGLAAGTAITGQLTYGGNGRPVTAATPSNVLGGVGTYSVTVPQAVVAGTVIEASQPGTVLVIDGPISGGAQFAALEQSGDVCMANCPALFGDGIAAGTTITRNVSTSTSFAGTISNGTEGSPGTILTVTGVSSARSPLLEGQVLTGSGVAPGTTIIAQLSGFGGGVGTYSLSGAGQAVGSTTLPASMLATQYVFEVSGDPQWSAPFTPMGALVPGNTLTVTTVAGGTITVGQTVGGTSFYTQTNARYTGSINDGQIANFVGGIGDGSGGAGTTLSVSAVTGSIPIAVGQIISGAGVTDGTEILAQIDGVTGGLGTYTVSGSPQAVSSSTPMSAAQSGTTLTVTSFDSGSTVVIGEAVTGPGVAPGTSIDGFGTGLGGVGTYTISGPPQWVAPSTVMTSTVPGSPLVADGTVITGQLSGTSGGAGVYTVSGDPQAVPASPMSGTTKEPLQTLIAAAPWDGVGFVLGQPNTPNFLRGDGQTVYCSYLANAGVTQTLALADQFREDCAGG